jgi:hypothetical protein
MGQATDALKLTLPAPTRLVLEGVERTSAGLAIRVHKGLSAGQRVVGHSRRAYSKALDNFLAFLGPRPFTRASLQEFRSNMESLGLAPSSGCALRRGELAGLTVPDLQQRDGRAVFVDISGKGGRIRRSASPTGSIAPFGRGCRRPGSPRAGSSGPSPGGGV